MFRIFIVEDETKSCEVLKSIISRNFPEGEVTGSGASVSEAKSFLQSNPVDLILLDIELPDGTGFDLLQQMPGYHFEIIFVTAYDHYAIRAIKYSAMDYILKPVDSEELIQALNKAKEKNKSKDSMQNLKLLLDNIGEKEGKYRRITLPTGRAYEIVNVNDIIRCEADQSYTNFFLKDGRRLTISNNLKYYEDILPADKFVRIHHHHLVNTDHVIRILKGDGNYAVMSDNSKIEISRRKKDEFVARFRN